MILRVFYGFEASSDQTFEGLRFMIIFLSLFYRLAHFSCADTAEVVDVSNLLENN